MPTTKQIMVEIVYEGNVCGYKKPSKLFPDGINVYCPQLDNDNCDFCHAYQEHLLNDSNDLPQRCNTCMKINK
jgi:hypothetical protein